MLKENYKPLFLSDIKEERQAAFAKTVDYYFPGELEQLILKNEPLLESSIVSQDQAELLKGWLDEDGCGTHMKLLYRASRDGWQSSNFHEKCDHQGPTLT
eukprot:627414-Ditylum_brightwellii.AAC.1